MIDRLFDLFQDLVSENGPAKSSNEGMILAATALMFEVARSDGVKQKIELTTIENILAETLNIRLEYVSDLMSAAEESVEAAHDLYQFTQVINDVFDYQRKKQLVLAMWQVALADGHVEVLEDHIIRRVAGLIHVSHTDFIQLKIQARGSLS